MEPEPFEWAKTQKLRKDWNDLTDDERNLYFKAVNAMKRKIVKSPRGHHNLYDLFVIIHGEINNKAYAHQTSGFLAWHRKYLLEYETALRTLSEEFKWVTVPYWDWSAEMFECKKQGVFLDEEPCLTYHGASKLLRDFGGPGTHSLRPNPNTHGSSGAGPVGCVTTGPFRGWKDHNGKCLSRGVNWKIHDQKPFSGRMRLAEIISEHRNFGSARGPGFRAVIEGIPHGMTHNYLGGHLRSFISPADPIFFSHHAYVDKIWATWQDCHGHDTEEVKQLLESGLDDHVQYYEETRTYGADKATDPMVFNFPLGDLPSLVATLADEESVAGPCVKSNTLCASCVHSQDGWCVGNPWDNTCTAFCTDRKCADSCNAPDPQLLDMNTHGPTVLPHWDLRDITPASMQSTLLLGDRSYTYAPDEFERHLEREMPELMANCHLDSHKRAQGMVGSLLEAQRLHHSCKPRGEAAYEHALMVKNAFNSASERNKDMETDKSPGMKAAFRNAEKAECNEMVMHKDGSKGSFQEEFDCSVDQPRFFLPWLGSAQWHALMADGHTKHEVFQDRCCAGNEQALAPGAVVTVGRES
jgi:tyrosinase